MRLIAATNRNLEAAVAAGTFRQDLYYRLHIVAIRVPALRERLADVLPLAAVLLTEAARRMGREPLRLTPEAADCLLGYSWPGNVRELQNTMERVCALAPGPQVELHDLPEEVRGSYRMPAHLNPDSLATLADVERAHILAVMALHGGNRAETARHLEIGTATLYRKLKQYGVAADVLDARAI